jgi:hypothetical protein
VEKFTQIRREKSQNSDVIKTNHRLRKLSVWSLGKAEELGIAFFFFYISSPGNFKFLEFIWLR